MLHLRRLAAVCSSVTRDRVLLSRRATATNAVLSHGVVRTSRAGGKSVGGCPVGRAWCSNDPKASLPQSSVEETLNRVNESTFQAPHASELIIALANAKAGNEPGTEVIDDDQDPRMEKVMRSLEGSKVVTQLSNGATIATLKALDALGRSESFAFKNLENSLVWRARQAPMRDLAYMLSFSYARASASVKKNGGSSKLYQEVVRALERRWVEVVDPQIFVQLIHYSESFNEQFLTRIIDRIIDVAEELTPSDLSMILSQLGEKKNRSGPLLKALTFHLSKGVRQLNAKEVSDCLFALKSLSYKDKEFIRLLCDAISLEEVSSRPIIRSVLTSLGQLKFPHKEVLSNIAAWMQGRLDELEQRDLVTFLLTTATVQLAPDNADKLYEAIIDKVSYESLKDVKGGDVIWLDVVWSLSMLGKQTESHLSSVLSPEFYNKLLYSHDHKNVGIILKMLNLNAVAKHLVAGYSGPLIPVDEDPLLRDVKAAVSGHKSALSKLAVAAFSTLASPPAHCILDFNTRMGFACDAVAVFDQRGSPQQIANEELLEASSKNGIKVALLVATLQDRLLNGCPGVHLSLRIRLLEAVGFKTLLVSHTDLTPKQKTIDRVKIVEKKLKALISVPK